MPAQNIWPGAAAWWRNTWQTESKVADEAAMHCTQDYLIMRIHSLDWQGPFTGLRVLVNGETRPQLKVLSRMIRAGGGTVILKPINLTRPFMRLHRIYFPDCSIYIVWPSDTDGTLQVALSKSDAMQGTELNNKSRSFPIER